MNLSFQVEEKYFKKYNQNTFLHHKMYANHGKLVNDMCNDFGSQLYVFIQNLLIVKCVILYILASNTL